MAVVRKRWRALMPDKAIKGPIRRRAGVGLDPVTLLLGGVRNQNFEQLKWSQVTVLFELNEMGQ